MNLDYPHREVSVTVPAKVLAELPKLPAIEARLHAFEREYGDLAFSGNDGRDLAHDIVQYPAMMVPRMQGGLIDCFRGEGRCTSIVDPFMGSGTILVEAQRRNLHFRGIDINPYAFLIATVKATPLSGAELVALQADVAARLAGDKSEALDHDFPGRDKWFRSDVATDLARLRRSIKQVTNVNHRRLMWACLGETVRLSSNSRTSTFKLHIRPEIERSRDINAVETFSAVLRRAAGLLKRERIEHGSNPQTARLDLMDVRDAKTPDRADLLVSSPPYGDNGTTVPYGQFSYLALQWIDLADVPSGSGDAVKNTHALDTRSLGGGLKDALLVRADLEARSPALANFLAGLQAENADNGRKRVVAFYRDLDAALARCMEMVVEGGYMVWTVGNRRVCGTPVPMDTILRELLEARGCEHVQDLKRVIPSKRMALKNSFADTMVTEMVVVVRNGE